MRWARLRRKKCYAERDWQRLVVLRGCVLHLRQGQLGAESDDGQRAIDRSTSTPHQPANASLRSVLPANTRE